jgi:hypothetical protein
MAAWRALARMPRLGRRLATACVGLCVCGVAMALDLNALWDFRDPAASEQRFRSALASASPDDALILHTQIARSLGLRQQFGAAREILEAQRPKLAQANAEARVRFALEWGRTWASGRHAPGPRGLGTSLARSPRCTTRWPGHRRRAHVRVH